MATLSNNQENKQNAEKKPLAKGCFSFPIKGNAPAVGEEVSFDKNGQEFVFTVEAYEGNVIKRDVNIGKLRPVKTLKEVVEKIMVNSHRMQNLTELQTNSVQAQQVNNLTK